MPDGELTIKAKRAAARQGYTSGAGIMYWCVMDTGRGWMSDAPARAIEPILLHKGIGKVVWDYRWSMAS
jgi:hypothetical protein